MEGKGTTNAICILRNITGRVLEVQKDVYLCFIGYSKAFDRVRHDEAITQLTPSKIDRKDIRLIKKMYSEHTAAMRVDRGISLFEGSKAWCQTRLCSFPTPFLSPYCEMILRSLGYLGVKEARHNVKNLRYADDTVTIAENKEYMQQLLDIVKE